MSLIRPQPVTSTSFSIVHLSPNHTVLYCFEMVTLYLSRS